MHKIVTSFSVECFFLLSFSHFQCIWAHNGSVSMCVWVKCVTRNGIVVRTTEGVRVWQFTVLLLWLCVVFLCMYGIWCALCVVYEVNILLCLEPGRFFSAFLHNTCVSAPMWNATSFKIDFAQRANTQSVYCCRYPISLALRKMKCSTIIILPRVLLSTFILFPRLVCDCMRYQYIQLSIYIRYACELPVATNCVISHSPSICNGDDTLTAVI